MSEALQTISKPSSPMLRSFEINPFRVLRLPVDVSTNEASIQAERISTLARAEIPPDEPDPLPWLPPTGIYEIQPAAQKIEEPFLRLTEQLLWFDFVRDASPTSIKSVLLNLKGGELPKYISEGVKLPAEIAPDDTAEAGVHAAIANAINQANLRLLMASSILNGVLVHQTNGSGEITKISNKDWKVLNDLRILPEVHTIIIGAADENTVAGNTGHHWKEALKRWNQILNHPWFNIYVGRCIEDLDDDFVSADDAETIEKSIRTRLADLAVAETRFLLLEGRYSPATEIISALAHSGFDKRDLGPSLRPIYHLFKSEISELKSLLDVTEQNDLNHIEAYFKRLEAIKKRWTAIDESGLIGLNQILDDAVEQSYLQLRTQAQPSAELDILLAKAVALTSTKSLQVRINSFQKELEEAKNRLCYFCREKPDYEKSVVLKGQQETHRETYGDTTTVHYQIRYAIVLRCERCARLHEFLRTGGWLIFAALSPALLGVALLLIVTLGVCLCPLIYFITFIIGWLVQFIKWIPYSISRILARFITPPEHRLFGDYKDSEAYQSLDKEFMVDYSVTPDWRSNAVKYIETN